MKTRFCILKPCALMIALALAAGVAGTAQAEEAVSTGALAAASGTALNLTVEQRLKEDLRVVMLDLIQSGAFGDTDPQRIALDMDEPAQRVGNLGVLVDSASAERARDGLHVLAITPGSAAERMGLRTGDVLLAVNGTPLVDRGSDASGRAAAASDLRRAVDAQRDGDALDLGIRRDGQTRQVSGRLTSVYLPAMHLTVGDGIAVASASPRAGAGVRESADPASGCGRISVFDVAPRQQGLHAATLVAIDGKLPGPSTSDVFRVSAGAHTLTVGESIESRYLSFNDRQRNAGNDHYKSLTIDVEPDTTYFLAARLNEDKRNEWKDGAYWDPVIWKQSTMACR